MESKPGLRMSCTEVGCKLGHRTSVGCKQGLRMSCTEVGCKQEPRT